MPSLVCALVSEALLRPAPCGSPDGASHRAGSSVNIDRKQLSGPRVIHPDTELRGVDPRVGMGVVATRRIPKGTITWARDALDLGISRTDFRRLPDLFKPGLDRYTYITGDGEYVLCWDHGRYMNHSCEPTCMSPGFDLEIAIRDIEAGEELTGDYAIYNIETGFDCLCSARHCRGRVEPQDRSGLVDGWDRHVRDALLLLPTVPQPLWPLVGDRDAVKDSISGRTVIPSCRAHFFAPDD